MCHSDPTSGHFGVKKTFNWVRERFYWKGVCRDAKELVRSHWLYMPLMHWKRGRSGSQHWSPSYRLFMTTAIGSAHLIMPKWRSGNLWQYNAKGSIHNSTEAACHHATHPVAKDDDDQSVRIAADWWLRLWTMCHCFCCGPSPRSRPCMSDIWPGSNLETPETLPAETAVGSLSHNETVEVQEEHSG